MQTYGEIHETIINNIGNKINKSQKNVEWNGQYKNNKWNVNVNTNNNGKRKKQKIIMDNKVFENNNILDIFTKPASNTALEKRLSNDFLSHLLTTSNNTRNNRRNKKQKGKKTRKYRI